MLAISEAFGPTRKNPFMPAETFDGHGFWLFALPTTE
jgi:hypothetical protein